MILILAYGIMAITLVGALVLLPRYRHARLAHYAMKELQSKFGIYSTPTRRLKPWQKREKLKYGTKNKRRKYLVKGSKRRKKQG